MVNEQNAGQNDSNGSTSSKSYMEPASKEQASSLEKARSSTETCLDDYADILFGIDSSDEETEEERLPTRRMFQQQSRLRRWSNNTGIRGDRVEPLKYDFCTIDVEEQRKILDTLEDLRGHICNVGCIIKEKRVLCASQKVDEIGGCIDSLERLVKPHATSRTIRIVYRRCIAAYHELLRSFESAEKETKENISREAIMQKHEDLTKWAKQTGVFREGNGSLDWQVHKDPALGSQIYWILCTIENTLLRMEEFASEDGAPDSDDSDIETAKSEYQKLKNEFEASLEVLAKRNRSLWSLWQSEVAMDLPGDQARSKALVCDEDGEAHMMAIDENFSRLKVSDTER